MEGKGIRIFDITGKAYDISKLNTGGIYLIQREQGTASCDFVRLFYPLRK